ncbi:MAG: hypothetical protein VXY07_16165 [Planctomycetota bacterium]|nr:hypothetical protein [Planctomycetota bacterium]MEC7430190.1 hypothetical protein [Planctomycetota bacterium]MEC7450457.1 hypothetical protein [Planctomycetota bacterium]MEC7498443.1 hypothetical protein [Planctomycetota bacterium]MEC7598733.1 hypothetical protein [Planctomycetota bacterium]
MSRTFKQVTYLGLGIGVVVGTMLALGFAAGWVSHAKTDLAKIENDDLAREMLLKASSASGGKSMAMATGRIDGDVEGLFVLDFTSGNLFCWVIDRRGGGFLGQFQTNVRADFGPIEQGRTPEYVMVTGGVNAAGGATAQGNSAQTVCYVSDANTGVVVGYSMIWNRTLQQASRPQQGALVKVAQAFSRDNSLIRE